jgi:hypothetical protein
MLRHANAFARAGDAMSRGCPVGKSARRLLQHRRMPRTDKVVAHTLGSDSRYYRFPISILELAPTGLALNLQGTRASSLRLVFGACFDRAETDVVFVECLKDSARGSWALCSDVITGSPVERLLRTIDHADALATLRQLRDAGTARAR